MQVVSAQPEACLPSYRVEYARSPQESAVGGYSSSQSKIRKTAKDTVELGFGGTTARILHTASQQNIKNASLSINIPFAFSLHATHTPFISQPLLTAPPRPIIETTSPTRGHAADIHSLGFLEVVVVIVQIDVAVDRIMPAAIDWVGIDRVVRVLIDGITCRRRGWIDLDILVSTRGVRKDCGHGERGYR